MGRGEISRVLGPSTCNGAIERHFRPKLTAGFAAFLVVNAERCQAKHDSLKRLWRVTTFQGRVSLFANIRKPDVFTKRCLSGKLCRFLDLAHPGPRYPARIPHQHHVKHRSCPAGQNRRRYSANSRYDANACMRRGYELTTIC